MKSYTDLEQSKRLANILPLESADMCFNISQRYNMPPLMTPYSKFNEFFNMEKTPDFLIPCWSLAALLKLIPSYIIQQGEVYFGILDLNECCLKYQTNDGVDLLETKYYDNYIDAAFEMVVWLKENNKL